MLMSVLINFLLFYSGDENKEVCSISNTASKSSPLVNVEQE